MPHEENFPNPNSPQKHKNKHLYTVILPIILYWGEGWQMKAKVKS
jgi:hypothetical protein